MKAIVGTTLLSFTALLLSACATDDPGTVVGERAEAGEDEDLEVAGEARPDATSARLFGGLGGPNLSPEVGEELDLATRARIAEILENQPLLEPAVWTNPDTGRWIRVTPTRTFQSGSQACRQFTIEVQGSEEPISGMACRMSGGDWQLVG